MEGNRENGISSSNGMGRTDVITFAEREYKILEDSWLHAYEKESDLKKKDAMKADREYGEMIHKSVIELLETFQRQNNSASSAGFILSEFKRLATFKPITPLTGKDSEWEDVFTKADGVVMQQNNRCGSVFRQKGKNDTAENTEGVAFSNDEGKTWFTNRHSLVRIGFPYVVPDEIKRKVLTKEEFAKMETEDRDEFEKLSKEHPELIQRMQEQMNSRERPQGGANGR